MLRVGLTGGLGSGKSTVAAIFAELGAYVAQSDAMGRDLMQPGLPAFNAIVDKFGPEVVTQDGTLDRAKLAKLSFEQGRVEDLNAIIHPAVIAAQAEWMKSIAAKDPDAICIIESALLFETKHGDVRDRFDRIIVVLAPEQLRIQRFIARQQGATVAEAQQRIAAQMSDFEKLQRSNFLIRNDGTLDDLRRQVDQLWRQLQAIQAER